MNKLRAIYSRIRNWRTRKSGGSEEEAEKVSPITAQLEKIADKCLYYALERYSRIKGKVEGLTLLKKLVKKIEKKKIILQAKDLQLLLRCCLHSLRYVSQIGDYGGNLMHNLVEDAKYCLEKSLGLIEKDKVPNAIYFLIRYFHEEDGWYSLDMATRVFKDLIQKMEGKNIENVLGDILVIFLHYMALYCPGTSTGPSLKLYPLPDDPSKLKIVPIKENLLPPMSKIIHEILFGHRFKIMDYRVWNILDTLFNLYINVANTCEYVRTRPNQTPESKRIWEQWDAIECTLLGSLCNFLNNIIFYDMNCKDKDFSQKLSKEKEKMHKDPEVEFDRGDALAKVMAFVMEKAVDSEVPVSAKSKLLDMLIIATKTLPTARNFSFCLPEKFLLTSKKIALSGDPGSVLKCNRLIHNLIDKHNLRTYFKTPRIFTEKMNEFKIESDPADWEYIKENKNTIYTMLFWNFLSQSDKRMSLEAIYSTICLMLVEVQDQSFAHDVAEMLIRIQDLVIINPDIQMRSPRIPEMIHSTVASILSLIVVLHDMKDLKNQVLEVVNRRSQVAPFLLPPLKTKYTTNEVNDYQDNLFFG